MSWDWKFPKYADSWDTLSRLCRKRDKNRCCMCGHTGSPDNPLQACHIVSKRHGGKDDLTNLRTLCRNCHSKEPGHGHMRRGGKSASKPPIPF